MGIICCIYTITNNITNKIYVGKTNDFNRRVSQHKLALRKNIHNNIYLQRAWNTYGEKSFVFEVLEEYPYEYLYSMEHYWCNMLDVHNEKYGYNTKPTDPFNKSGSSAEAIEKTRKALIGRKLSLETRKKLSDAHKGKIISAETKLKHSIAAKGRKASEETRKKLSIYRYNNPLRSFIGKRHPEKLMKQIANKIKKPVIQYDLNMKFIKIWESATDVYKQLGISSQNIGSCCNFNRKQAGGYLWRYKNKN